MTPAEWVDGAAGPVVRPYAMVGGRTQAPRHPFDLVAFVVTVTERLHGWAGMQPEHVAILQLCRHPRSVSEVAGYLDLPIGVVRVLLGDLLDAQAVRVRQPADPHRRPSVDVIREVLHGLRAL